MLSLPTPHPISVEMAIRAKELALKHFPPRNLDEVFVTLTSLNLLNAYVKLPGKYSVANYTYIKGVAGMLFDYIDDHPIKGISIYNNDREHVTYFRIYGLQISFHYVIFQKKKSHRMHRPQTWDGLRLQLVSPEIFLMATSRMTVPRQPSLPFTKLRSICGLGDRPLPARENMRDSFVWSMRFDITKASSFLLYRRKDDVTISFIRYDGSNFSRIVGKLRLWNKLIPVPKEIVMPRQRLLFVCPQLRIYPLLPDHYTDILARNNYLVVNNKYYNLLLSYKLALYIAERYPSVRFVSTLNANRAKVKTRIYGYRGLLSVPNGSYSRSLKVWLPIDKKKVLTTLSMHHIPKCLLDDYEETEDYYQEYEITFKNGLKGLFAYRRHHILKPKYRDIVINHYHASIQNEDGMWALYSLLGERFKTGFCYDSINFDKEKYIVYGQIGKVDEVLYSFF